MLRLTSLRKMARAVGSHFATERILLTPFTHSLKSYDQGKFRADIYSACNVTLLAISQSIAFAAIAGLPVIYGVMCSTIASIVAPLFSSSRHTVLGPTNASAFMLFSFFSVNPSLHGRETELLPLLVLMVGIATIIGAISKVADLMQFISRSVLVGYLSGAAVLIIANQLVHFLGIAPILSPDAGSSFAALLTSICQCLHRIDFAAVTVGLAALAIYLALRKWRPKYPCFSIALLLSSVIFGSLIHGKSPFFANLQTFSSFNTHSLIPQLPHVFREGFFNDFSAMIGVAFAIGFLCTLENTLMSKSLASRSGDLPNVNQDMFAVGMANLACAFTGGMPASGSLTRSALNVESGAATRFSSLFSGILCLAMVITIAIMADHQIPIIAYIPKAALATLVIAVACSLFNLRNIRICLHSTSDDAIVLILTFVASLLAPLHVAIFLGVALSISLFLRKASRPFLVEYEFTPDGNLLEKKQLSQRPIPAISIVHVEGDLFFGASELFRTQLHQAIADPAIQIIILRLKNARHLDATSVMALEDMILYMREQGLHLLISGASREVYSILKKSGILQTLQATCDRSAKESNFFLANPRNPNISTRNALKRAQQLLGTDKADIRIFVDPNKQKSQP